MVFLAGLFLLLAGCQENATTEDALLWGGWGTTSGKFNKPRAVAVCPDNRVYVVDMTARIQVFSPQGQFLYDFRTPACEKGKPTGLGFTREGRLLVADTHYHRILLYTPQGELLQQWGQYGTAPEEFVFVTDVAGGPDGSVYATQYGDAFGEYDRVQKFDATGRFLLAWGKRGSGPGEFERPMAVALDREGHVLVADACNHRLQVFTPEGKFLAQWGELGDGPGQMKYPYGVAVAPDGTIYVSEFGNNRLQWFSPSGQSLGLYGKAGRGSGEFADPWDVSVGPDGRVYVSDARNHRIQALPRGKEK